MDMLKKPIRIKKGTAKIGDPWDFSPSNTDQRAQVVPAAGDYYGTGFKAKVGRLRSDTVGYNPVTKKELETPPKSVV